MKDYILARLHEPSTIRGLIWCLAAFGVVTLDAEQKEAVMTLAMALVGAGGLLPDKPGE